MKRLFIIALCLFIGIASSFGQVSKKEKIYSGHFFGTLTSVEKYNSQNQLEYIQIILTARDQQYQHIENYFTAYSGSPTEFVQFCDEMIALAEAHEKDVHTEIQGITVSLDKLLGAQQLTVHEKTPGGTSYKQFTPKQIEKVKEKFLKWADKKSLALL